MLVNYIKTALRTVAKFRGYSAINTLGLSIGLACCILILLFVRNELSYDTFHGKKNRIYRSFCRLDIGARKLTTPNLPMPFGPVLMQEIPQIQATVRFQRRNGVVRYRENLVREELLFCDPAIMQVFSFALLSGDRRTALRSPSSIVVTQEMAKKYFGTEDPIGKKMTIRLSDTELIFFVTAVAENVPENSSIKFDFLVPYDRIVDLSEGARQRAQSWDSFNSTTFVLLHKECNPADLEAEFQSFSKKHFSYATEILLQPLTDIHLNPELGSGGLEPVSDPKYSYILAGIALLILFIACINFMTITLGRSASRAREVCVRRVFGAQRFQLLKQFSSEAMLRSKWKELAPELPFEYYFLDQDVARQYRAEQRWGKLVSYSSVLAIVIASFGLFGLSALSVSRRTKEIGIRKVLGASLHRLVGLINQEFLLLVILGNVIAWPLAWFAMHRWLQGFAYRIQIQWWVFALAAGIALLVALLSVSTQAIRAALANPVERLRCE
jgi:hypothetical protein